MISNLFFSALAALTFGTSVIAADFTPTVNSLLSIEGMQYKVFGRLTFDDSFNIAEDSSYALEIKKDISINYSVSHKYLYVIFQCTTGGNSGCGEGLILHWMGMDFVISSLYYDRETEKFDVRVHSIISGTIESYIEEELEKEIGAQTNFMLSKLKTLVRERQTDPAEISKAIQQVLFNYMIGREETSGAIGLNGYTGLKLVPGADKVIPYGDINFHIKSGDPLQFYLYYTRTAEGKLSFNRVQGYFRDHPNMGVKTTMMAHGSEQEALIEYFGIDEEHGMTVDAVHSGDNIIDGLAAGANALIGLAGGNMEPDCCNLNIVGKTIQQMTIRSSQEYISQNYSAMEEQGIPANLLDGILNQVLPEL